MALLIPQDTAVKKPQISHNRKKYVHVDVEIIPFLAITAYLYPLFCTSNVSEAFGAICKPI